MSGTIHTQHSCKTAFFSGVSVAALVLCCSFSSPASAGNYTASDGNDLNSKIALANADPDANATITLTGSFATVGTLPSATKPITIDTGSFTLTGIEMATTNGQTLTFRGTIVGNTAQRGFFFDNAGGSSSLINDGSITGGSDGASTTSVGVSLSGSTTFVNNGTVTGGSNTGAGAGGFGLMANRASTVTNNGVIQGGNSATGVAAPGVFLGGIGTVTSTLTNNGTIRGGDGGAGTTNGTGVQMRLNGALINHGTIEGGSNSIGITVQTTPNVSIVNSGSILGGLTSSGRANAITTDATSSLNLELDAGSHIEGNVLGNATRNDTLNLGGTGTDSFDISAIGPQYQNFDTFEKTGTGIWTLTGVGTATTDWTIDDGTLLVGNSSGDSVIGNITNLGTLGGNGTIFGNVTNSGTVAPGSNTIGTLTISGDYTSNGGALDIESVLGGDASSTDRLVVTGNTAGATNVRVTNLGGTGAQTIDGIKIIDVGGVSAGTFALQGDYVYHGDQAVVAGAYAYRLEQNGITTPGDGDWYLRSDLAVAPSLPAAPLYQPGAPIYEVYPQILQQLNGLGTLYDRVGDRYWQTNVNPVPSGSPDGVWVHTGGVHGRVEPDSSTAAATYDYDLWKFEGGVDGELAENAAGRLIGGLTARFGTISGDVSSIYGNGKIDSSGYGVGATLTWYGQDGFYVDAQSQATWYDTDLKSDLLDGDLKSGDKGFGYALSLETGRRFVTGGAWSITPQAQLAYSSVNFDDFRDRFGAPISLDSGDSLNGRVGVALDRDESWKAANGKTAHAKLYGSANLYYEFLDGTDVDLAGMDFKTENDRLSAGLTAGGSYSWNDGRTSIYGEVSARSSLENVGDSYVIGGTAGLRVKW